MKRFTILAAIAAGALMLAAVAGSGETAGQRPVEYGLEK